MYRRGKWNLNNNWLNANVHSIFHVEQNNKLFWNVQLALLSVCKYSIVFCLLFLTKVILLSAYIRTKKILNNLREIFISR